jgi:hypothetical protein
MQCRLHGKAMSSFATPNYPALKRSIMRRCHACSIALISVQRCCAESSLTRWRRFRCRTLRTTRFCGNRYWWFVLALRRYRRLNLRCRLRHALCDEGVLAALSLRLWRILQFLSGGVRCIDCERNPARRCAYGCRMYGLLRVLL